MSEENPAAGPSEDKSHRKLQAGLALLILIMFGLVAAIIIVLSDRR